MEYSGHLGGQYGGKLGGQYGYQQRGDRIDLIPVGQLGPEISTAAIIDFNLDLTHSGLSSMSVTVPPFRTLNEDAYVDGTMRYFSDGEVIFSAEINDYSIGDDNSITLSGPAIEDIPLTHGDARFEFGEIATADAIETVLQSIESYESVVHPAPPRPLNNRLVADITASGDWADMLETGEQVDDSLALERELPDSMTSFLPRDYIPTLHDTSPIAITDNGLTTTQTTIFTECEDYISPQSAVEADPQASGGAAARIETAGMHFGINFGFDHDIPPGHFEIAYRARVDHDGSEPYDRLEFELDGQTIRSTATARSVNYYKNDYLWYTSILTYDGQLDAVDRDAGDDPHRLTVEKIEGNDRILFDCIAFFDNRFGFNAKRNEQVDANNALSGPQLYPFNLAVVLDAPDFGADIDSVEWRVNFDKPSKYGVPGLTIPKIGKTPNGGDYYNDEEVIVGIDNKLPADTTITKIYPVVFIDNYSDPDRTVSPTENTISQTVEAAEMRIDGTELSVIDDNKEFEGSPMAILQQLHEYADRRLAIEHGTDHGSIPRLDSFKTGDTSLIAGNSDDWILTSTTRDIADEGDANTVRVIGANIEDGAYYQGIARDKQAIDRRNEQTPDSDDGVRLVELRDETLTSNNDCLSKARTELQDRSRMSIGGDVETAPMLIEPGYPYALSVFDETDEDYGYGLNYGLKYGYAGSGALVSSLESVGYSESAGSASTSLSFERESGLLQTIEEIVNTSDPRPTPAISDAPVVDSPGAFPSPDDEPPGGVEPPPDDGGGTPREIAFLDDDPLNSAAWKLGGSAGPGTHGGMHVDRPAEMPTKSASDFIVRTASQLRFALDAGPGYIIYIDADIDISSFDGVSVPRDTILVGGFCDPSRTENGGRGPILYNHDRRPYNRRHLVASDPIEVWGVSFEGPRGRFDTLEAKYFDPDNYPGSNTEFYVSALWCYPDLTESASLIYGCEFRGWNVAGLETGERTRESTVNVERCTFINNCMESLGYGIEQWNGHLTCNLCYFDFNRHAISGFGYNTESWTVTNSMHGPNAISHAFDMHGLRQNIDSFNGNLAGKSIRMENVTIPFTKEHVRNPGSGQEGMRLRGVSEQVSEVNNCHFYHSQPPDPPGEQGDPFWQTYPDQPNHFVRLTASNNQYGERLKQGAGAPLNAPIKPIQ